MPKEGKLNEKSEKVTECQVKTENVWAVFVDTLCLPHWTLTWITPKGQCPEGTGLLDITR